MAAGAPGCLGRALWALGVPAPLRATGLEPPVYFNGGSAMSGPKATAVTLFWGEPSMMRSE